MFLGSGGNAALADRLLKVTDVVLEEDGASQPVFGVMVGAAGNLRHHAGLRRGGPNDGCGRWVRAAGGADTNEGWDPTQFVLGSRFWD